MKPLLNEGSTKTPDPPASRSAAWEEIAENESPSWYLDPLVAEQKRKLHVALLAGVVPVRRALKTDSFEEAYGNDSPLRDLGPLAAQWFSMDLARGTARRAKLRHGSECAAFLAADVRLLPLQTGSIDLVFSNSSLDHFRTAEEFETSIAELARVLAPGGRLIFTTDNPLNPGYWLLRAYCSLPMAPFPLGYSPAPAKLREILEANGFDIESTGLLIHNPRGISTGLFLLLRRVLGKYANPVIRATLAAFQALDRLPTRHLTACFLTVHARRRSVHAQDY